MKKVTLPSGKELEIHIPSFQEAHRLQKAIAKEAKSLKIDASMELDANFFKDLVCSAIASDEITDSLNACLKRCLYDGKRIDKDTFEDEDARGDYFMIYYEVIQEALRPFVKGLSSKFGAIFPKGTAQ